MRSDTTRSGKPKTRVPPFWFWFPWLLLPPGLYLGFVMFVNVWRGLQWIASTDFRPWLPMVAGLLPPLVALGSWSLACFGAAFSLATLLLSASVLIGRRRPGGHAFRRMLVVIMSITGVGMTSLVVIGMWGDYLIFRNTAYAHPVLQGICLPIVGLGAILGLPLLLAFRAAFAPASVGLALGEDAGGATT